MCGLDGFDFITHPWIVLVESEFRSLKYVSAVLIITRDPSVSLVALFLTL